LTWFRDSPHNEAIAYLSLDGLLSKKSDGTAAVRSRYHAPNATLLDNLASWITRRSRRTRIILVSLIAAVVTCALALLLYNIVFSLSLEQLQFGPINADNILSFISLILILIGIALYWVGWRVMIGFDLGEEPYQPGRAGALWVLFGGIVLVGVIITALLMVAQATAPI
jgi:hypothetical protein